MNPLYIILALSLLGNAFLGHAYLSERDTATVVKTETVFVKAAAEACDKGVGELVTKADENKRAAAPKIAAAASAAALHNTRADAILSTPAAVPGDACKSAEAAVSEWWAGRAKP